jgi:hypothetical protein
MVGAHGSPRRPPLRPIRFYPEGPACRGEAPPRPYFLVANPHVIDGLGLGDRGLVREGENCRLSMSETGHWKTETRRSSVPRDFRVSFFIARHTVNRQ